MLSKILFALAAMSLVALATPAAAQATNVEVRTQSVSYADLNLSSHAGAQALMHRVRNAARNVCGDRLGVRPLHERRQSRACMEAALEQAVSTLNQPMVSALYEERYQTQRTTITASLR